MNSSDGVMNYDEQANTMTTRARRKRTSRSPGEDWHTGDDVARESDDDDSASEGSAGSVEDEEAMDNTPSKHSRVDATGDDDGACEADRITKSRERNRVHARNTRERKKNQIQEYQRKIKMLMNERHHLNSLLVDSAVAGTLIPGAAQDPATAALLWGQEGLGAADAAAQDFQHQTVMMDLKEKIKRETELLESIDDVHALKKDGSACQAEDLINIRKERNRIHARKTRLRKKQALKEAELLLRTLENDVRRLRNLAITSLPTANRHIAQQSAAMHASMRAAVPSMLSAMPGAGLPPSFGSSQLHAISSPFGVSQGGGLSNIQYAGAQRRQSPSQAESFTVGNPLGSKPASTGYPYPRTDMAASAGAGGGAWPSSVAFPPSYAHLNSYPSSAGRVISNDEKDGGIPSANSSPSLQMTPRRIDDADQSISSDQPGDFSGGKDISIVSPADQSEPGKRFLLPLNAITPSLADRAAMSSASGVASTPLNDAQRAGGISVKEEMMPLTSTSTAPPAPSPMASMMPNAWAQPNPMATYAMMAALQQQQQQQQQGGMFAGYHPYQAALTASLSAGALGGMPGGGMMMDPRLTLASSMAAMNANMGPPGGNGSGLTAAARQQIFNAGGMPSQVQGLPGTFFSPAMLPFGGMPSMSGLDSLSGAAAANMRPQMFSGFPLQQQQSQQPSLMFPGSSQASQLRPDPNNRPQSMLPGYLPPPAQTR